MSRVRLRGCLELHLKAIDGALISAIKKDNLIVDVGRAFIGRRIQSNNPPSDVISYLGLGQSNLAPAGAQFDLIGPLFRKTIGTIITTSLDGAAPYFQCIASFASNEGNGTLAEAGLFTAAAGGFMLGRTTFSTSSKTTSNTVSCTYTVSF